MRVVFVRCRLMVAALLLIVVVGQAAEAGTVLPASPRNPVTQFVVWILGKIGLPPGNPDEPTPEGLAKIGKSHVPK